MEEDPFFPLLLGSQSNSLCIVYRNSMISCYFMQGSIPIFEYCKICILSEFEKETKCSLKANRFSSSKYSH